MEPHERTKLIKLGADGINNHARCLINMGKYAECLEVISAGNVKHFGDNFKLMKVFVVSQFNLDQLEECSEYLRKCERNLEDIVERRMMDEEYEAGLDNTITKLPFIVF